MPDGYGYPHVDPLHGELRDVLPMLRAQGVSNRAPVPRDASRIRSRAPGRDLGRGVAGLKVFMTASISR